MCAQDLTEQDTSESVSVTAAERVEKQMSQLARLRAMKEARKSVHAAVEVHVMCVLPFRGHRCARCVCFVRKW